MYEKNYVIWCCCAFLLVAYSSSKHQRDFTNDNKKNDSTMLYELDINSMKNFDDDITTVQYILRKISTKDMQYEFSTASNYWHNDDLLRNEFTTHFIKNHSNDNQILKESQQSTNKTEINGEKNFTSQKIHENWMKIENKNSSTSHDILTNFNTDNNKKDFVRHEMCDNITCIPLCCPIGEHLIKENCISEENEEYLFLNLNRHVNNALQNENKRMDGLFQWIVREPYDETKFIFLFDLSYNDTRYMLFANGTLYFPYANFSIESTCYCFNVMDQNQFDIRVCTKTKKKIYRYLIDHDSDVREVLDRYMRIQILRLVSMLFTLITFIIYSILPELRNIHGFILRNYCGLMFVAYMADMMNNEISAQYVEYPMCFTIALICYFCYLATCFWLTVMSFDMWWTFRDFRSLQRSGKQEEKKKMILYSAYAWGSPFFLTIICVIINFVPNVLIPPKLGVYYCWFNKKGADFVYYWPPILICVLSSICLFIITSLKITRFEKDTAHHLKDSESRLYDKNKKWFRLYFKLFIIVFTMVGITWIMAIVLWSLPGSMQEWHYFTILFLDMMQSFGIFIIFVCKKTIKQQLLKQFGCQNCSVLPKTRRTAVVTSQNTCTTTSATISFCERVNSFKHANRRAKNLSGQRETDL